MISKRINKLVSLLESNNLPAVLVTSKNDILYYTGYKVSDSAFLVIDKKSAPKLLLSPLDNEAKNLKLNVKFLKKKQDLNFLKEYKFLGYDEYNLSAINFQKIKKITKLKEASNIIKSPRNVKDDKEIELIRKAVKITKQSQKNLDFLGKEEKDVAFHVDKKFREQSAENAFDTIVASGNNGFYIHHNLSNKKIKKGELVILDSGARYENYCADLTRMFFYGLDKKRKKIVEDVTNIQKQIIDFIEPGKKFLDIQKFYSDLMKKKRYKIMHAFGHGIGLSVHESLDTLEKNSLVTVEPGVYMKKFGGCRIEDIILIKDKSKIL